MAHKALVGGTAYGISGGKTLVNGTAYSISKGKTLVNGTAYEIAFDSKENHVSSSGEILDSWAVISACTYLHYYSLGNWKRFTTTSGITVTMEIIAFNVDYCPDTGTNAPITWLAKGIYWAGQHSSTTTQPAYGWVSSLIRSRLQSGGNIYNSIPAEVMNVIKTVRKYDMYYPGGSSYVDTKKDKLWIPNYREMYGGSSWEHVGPDYTSYFNSFSKRIKYDVNGYANYWWLRTVSSASGFWYVNNTGYGNGATPNNNYGVVIGFCT